MTRPRCPSCESLLSCGQEADGVRCLRCGPGLPAPLHHGKEERPPAASDLVGCAFLSPLVPVIAYLALWLNARSGGARGGVGLVVLFGPGVIGLLCALVGLIGLSSSETAPGTRSAGVAALALGVLLNLFWCYVAFIALAICGAR